VRKYRIERIESLDKLTRRDGWQERFKKIARAYQTLSDPSTRKQHDREIGLHSSEPLNMQTAFSF
jgi:curved DNA-binding protein CbpA